MKEEHKKMIRDIATEERVPINEIKNMELGELGLLIVNECIKGNHDYVYDTLLKKFIEISKNPDKNIYSCDLTDWGLIRVEVNQGLWSPVFVKRKIPLLNYVFKKSEITSKPSASNPELNYQVVNFIDMLRDVFLIQGGLRCIDLTDKMFVEDNDEIHIVLDFMEYKCNELYKEHGGLL